MVLKGVTMKKCNTHFIKKLSILILLLVSIMTLLTGCGSSPKNFTVSDLTITLNSNFTESKSANFDVYIKSDNVVFTAVAETMHDLETAGYEISSLNDYCLEIMDLNKTPSSELKKRNNYYYFTNTKTTSGANYTYVHCMFESSTSYWVCEFVCKTKHFKHYEEQIYKWADSIVIK